MEIKITALAFYLLLLFTNYDNIYTEFLLFHSFIIHIQTSFLTIMM